MNIKKTCIVSSTVLLLGVSTQLWSQTTQSEEAIQPKTQQQAEAVSQSQAGTEVIRHPDGSVSADLKGRFQMYSVARMVDGKVVYSCQDHDDLEAGHQHPAKPTAVERGEQ